MHLAYTPGQEQLRHELRGYFAGLMTPELRAGLADTGDDYGDGQAYRQIVRQLGRDGWLALGWPAEYGGRARAKLDPPIFPHQAATPRGPAPLPALHTPAPTLMRVRTP